MAQEASRPASRVDLVRALREAAITALIAFGMFLPLIGFNTVQNIHNELVLETRWPLLAALVGIITVGRFIHALLIAPWLQRRAMRPRQQNPVVAVWRARFGRWLIPFALGFAVVYPPLALSVVGFQGAVKWIDNFGVQILIYVMLGWGLNIVVGLAGLLDLGYVAFYAVGAYSYALLAKTFGLSFWLLLPLAGCLAAFWGILLGFPVLRLRGDYLAIVTLAFGEIIRLVLINWVPVTNGYAGISSIPRPSFFGIPFNASDEGFAARLGLEFSPIYRTIFLYYLILGLALVTLLVLTTWIGMASVVLALLIVLVVAMLLTSLVNWTIERVAYRPLRGSFRLAPLISAIGMSIFLSNFVQVAQGPRVKSIPPLFNDVIVLMSSPDGYEVSLSYKQIMVWVVTAALLAAFWFVVTKTALGRAQRACEQDQKMASLLGIDVDRTVSITFVLAAALAAVAGTMYLVYYGVVSFADGFVPGVKAFTAAVLGGIGSLPGAVLGGLLIGLIETMWSAYFSTDYKDVAAFSILAITMIFLPQGILGRPDVEKV
jgi:branched-chain amino acid transport system permease protein